MAEDNDRLVAIRPLWEGQYLFKGVASHDQDINGVHEFFVPVILRAPAFARSRQPVEVAVFPGNETIKTGCDKRGSFHIFSFYGTFELTRCGFLRVRIERHSGSGFY